MTQITKIVGDVWPHWNKPRLHGYIFEEVLDESSLAFLKKSAELIFANNSTNTFLTHRTIFKLGDTRIKLVSHAQNNREQHVLWDLISHPEYYYQNIDTIKEWSGSTLKLLANPIFCKVIQKFESLEPINSEPEVWIPVRCHMNVLTYDKCLTVHQDTDPIIYNKSVRDARIKSMTFYLNEIGLGGEFWTSTGFVYKPKINSAIMINGNQIPHGVNNNMDPDKKTRLAFSCRWMHKDDLFLPGDPSKTLYNSSI